MTSYRKKEDRQHPSITIMSFSQTANQMTLPSQKLSEPMASKSLPRNTSISCIIGLWPGDSWSRCCITSLCWGSPKTNFDKCFDAIRFGIYLKNQRTRWCRENHQQRLTYHQTIIRMPHTNLHIMCLSRWDRATSAIGAGLVPQLVAAEQQTLMLTCPTCI